MKTLNTTLFLLFAISSSMFAQKVFSWKEADAVKTEFQKVAVIGSFPKIDLKSSFEDEITERLRKQGVNASASIDIFGPKLSKKNADPEKVAKYLKSKGYDAVLLVTVSDVEKKKEYVQGSTVYTPTAVYGRFGRYYGTAYRRTWSPGYFRQERNFYLETNLYDLSEGSLVWLFEYELSNPNSIKSASKTYAKKLIKSARKDEVLVF